MANPEKAPGVTEVLTVPLSGVAETVEKLVTLIARINDLYDAEKALVVARTEYANGHTDVAKNMVNGIFIRLQDLGKAPKDLDAVSVMQKIQNRETKDLVVKLKEQRLGTGTAVDPDIKRMVDKTPDLIDPTEAKTPTSKAKSEKAQKKIETDLAAKRVVVDTREEAFFTELNQLMKEVGIASTETAVKKQLIDMQNLVNEGWLSTTAVASQVVILRDKIKTTLFSEDKVNELEIKSLIEAKRKKTKKLNVVVKAADKIIGGRDVVAQINTLVEGLNKIEAGANKGLDLQEVARTLRAEEARELRKFLSSGVEIIAGQTRPPNYDEVYVELNKKMDKNISSSDKAIIMRLARTVDANYKEFESNEGVDQVQMAAGRERVKQGQMFDGNAELDPDTGLPLHGVEYMGGAANHENLQNIYGISEERFHELYEEVPGGGYRPKNYQEQMVIAMRHAEMRQRGYHGQHEAFMNVNMKDLFTYMQEYDDGQFALAKARNPGLRRDAWDAQYSIRNMVDDDYYTKFGVTKLKESVMGNEPQRKYFEKWWIQEKLFETRRLAYEGQFEKRQGSTRMVRFNSLDEIVGVSTSVKGYATWMSMSFNVIDQQNNAYVNQELMGKLNAFWTNQGVDFRLDNFLKTYREEICLFNSIGEKGKRIGDIAMYDTASFMQKDITEAEYPGIRAELGIPAWRDIKWGTMIYKYSAEDKRAAVRKVAWRVFAKEELGIDWTDPSLIPANQQDRIMNMYQNMFDLAFNFASSHKLLNTMIGDASFTEGKVELPGAAAEMHLKLDPLLYSRLFVPRFNWLNTGFKELWFLFDPGVRDYVAMAPQDYAGHLTTFDVAKYKLWKKEADPGRKAILKADLTVRGLEGENGSLTIMSGMLGAYDAAGIAALSDVHIEAAFELQQTLEKALWHYGAQKPGEGHHAKETDIMFELGVNGERSTAYRRSASKISKKLMEPGNIPSPTTLALIDWKKYCEIVQNPRVVEFLSDPNPLITSEMKWAFFAKTFGEGSFDHTSASTKRPGDHTMKYSFENYNKYVETFQKWLQAPFNKVNDDALNEVPKAVNAPAMRPLQLKRFKVMRLLSETLGRAEFGGGSAYRIETNPKDQSTKFDTTNEGVDENGHHVILKGVGEDGDNQLPAYKIEKIKNNRLPGDPIKNKSVAESRGYVPPQDANWWIDQAKGLYAEGVLSENDLKELNKEILNGSWWEPKLGLLPNLWRYRKLEPVLEWIAPQFGITAHELEHILEENTEKTFEKLWANLNGGSAGGGHH